MNPMKFCSGKNRKPEECTNIGFCDSKITLGSSSSTMEYCVICSRKVFVVNHDSLPWADVKLENWVPKAEVTSRFLKSLDKVCRLLADTDDQAYECIRSGMFETKYGSDCKCPILCQECADKVQAAEMLTNLLKVQVSEIRSLLANTQLQKNVEVIQSETTSNQATQECAQMNKPNGKIKYERESLIRIRENLNKATFFDTLGHGFPDLVRSFDHSKMRFASANILLNSSQLSNQPISSNQNPTECPVEKLRKLLGDPKLSPKNFDTVAIHIMDLPLDYVHTAIPMLLETAIDMPEFSKQLTTLLNFTLEKLPSYQAIYRKLISDHFKSEIRKKFSENPLVMDLKTQMVAETDENICDNLQMDLEQLKYVLKRRSLNIFKLMGLFYKEKLIGSETIVETVNTLIKTSEEHKLEYVCLLFKIVGDYLERDASVNAQWLESQFSYLRQWAEGKKFSLKMQGLILNVLQFYKNNWKWEGWSETNSDHATLMIFQIYSASVTKSFEALINSAIFNFYFSGTEVGVFAENLCKLVAAEQNIGSNEDAGKLVRLLIANKNISKLETLLAVSTALKCIGKDVTDISKTANELAQFLVEIFSEESNMNWLLVCGKYIHLENSLFWERLVTESFERLACLTNVHRVRMAFNGTTKKPELIELFATWEAQRITNRSKKVVETLRPKIYKGASLNELRHVLQKNKWNPNQKFTARLLTEAICTLSWNTLKNNFNDQKLKLLLPLLDLPNSKMFPTVSVQVEAFCRRLKIPKSKMEQVWNIMHCLNLIPIQ